MSAFVVDTNVPVVANGKSEQADPDCVIACIDALGEVRNKGMIVLDNAGIILHEYMRNLSLSGQPGPGDLFLKWVWNVQADARRCEQVHLTPVGRSTDAFAEFPPDPEMAAFDRSDRKFVAAAIASRLNPDVLNAVDSDWVSVCTVLARRRVNVRFLCPQHVCPAG